MQSWIIASCFGKLSSVRCYVWKIVSKSVQRRPCYSLDRLICKHLIMKKGLESGSCARVGFVWCLYLGMLF